MFIETYAANTNNDAAKFGVPFAAFVPLIQQGVGAIMSLFGGGSSIPGQAKGLAAITSATQQIISAMQALKNQVGQGNFQELYNQAQQYAAMLSDHNKIYQAKKGNDAAVLSQAKQQANQILQEMAALGQQVNPVQTGVNQAGQVISAGGTFTQRLLADNTILYIGAGLLALYWFTQKKQ